MNRKDETILKKLAAEVAKIARLPVQREKAELWRRLNNLEKTRPMVWINELPGHEMNVNDELTCKCEDGWARSVEGGLLWTLYLWKHMPGDMVVSDYLVAPIAINNTGFNTWEDVDIVRTDDNSGVVSRTFKPRITKPEDVKIITDPVVTVDEAATARTYEAMNKLFKDIIEVRKEGLKHYWFTPWDNLIRVWGVEQAMIDMVDRPEMVNAVVGRFVEASLRELDQYEKLNLLTLNNDNTRIGSGGYGYTDQLPGKKFDPAHVRPANMWGCSNAQIFSEVSPEMHWEFALKHDIPWLKRWGLNYYGCCEPLDGKLEILRRIPNLRKVSMSPWIKIDRAVKAMGADFVFSFKPNPALLAGDDWHPGQVRSTIKEILDKTRDCRVEIILKDVSTCRYKPQRVWEWEKIVMDLVHEYEP